MTSSEKRRILGKCLRRALEDMQKNPERILMQGPGGSPEQTSHFWTEDDTGEIHDNAADTVPEDYVYSGRQVDHSSVLQELREMGLLKTGGEGLMHGNSYITGYMEKTSADPVLLGSNFSEFNDRYIRRPDNESHTIEFDGPAFLKDLYGEHLERHKNNVKKYNEQNSLPYYSFYTENPVSTEDGPGSAFIPSIPFANRTIMQPIEKNTVDKEMATDTWMHNYQPPPYTDNGMMYKGRNMFLNRFYPLSDHTNPYVQQLISNTPKGTNRQSETGMHEYSHVLHSPPAILDEYFKRHVIENALTDKSTRDQFYTKLEEARKIDLKKFLSYFSNNPVTKIFEPTHEHPVPYPVRYFAEVSPAIGAIQRYVAATSGGEKRLETPEEIQNWLNGYNDLTREEIWQTDLPNEVKRALSYRADPYWRDIVDSLYRYIGPGILAKTITGSDVNVKTAEDYVIPYLAGYTASVSRKS